MSQRDRRRKQRLQQRFHSDQAAAAAQHHRVNPRFGHFWEAPHAWSAGELIPSLMEPLLQDLLDLTATLGRHPDQCEHLTEDTPAGMRIWWPAIAPGRFNCLACTQEAQEAYFLAAAAGSLTPMCAACGAELGRCQVVAATYDYAAIASWCCQMCVVTHAAAAGTL